LRHWAAIANPVARDSRGAHSILCDELRDSAPIERVPAALKNVRRALESPVNIFSL
jgi:hypothetical protein